MMRTITNNTISQIVPVRENVMGLVFATISSLRLLYDYGAEGAGCIRIQTISAK